MAIVSWFLGLVFGTHDDTDRSNNDYDELYKYNHGSLPGD